MLFIIKYVIIISVKICGRSPNWWAFFISPQKSASHKIGLHIFSEAYEIWCLIHLYIMERGKILCHTNQRSPAHGAAAVSLQEAVTAKPTQSRRRKITISINATLIPTKGTGELGEKFGLSFYRRTLSACGVSRTADSRRRLWHITR